MKVKGCKVIYHGNNHKKTNVAILISGVDFKAKKLLEIKEVIL